MINGYEILVGEPDRRRALGILRLIWDDNIKMALKIYGFGYGLDLSQAVFCEHGNKSLGSIKGGEFTS
jgi:hypothetical protein